MNTVNPDSLALTLDTVDEAYFFQWPLTESQREQTAGWIASRQGLPGSYANMFAPTENDFKEGVRLFTGERVQSRVGTSHILGEEACRALILLDVADADVGNALERASLGMMSRLASTPSISGMYCCGTCTPALWRHLAVGGLEDAERRLAAGMRALKAHRDGSGKWRRFPFYYTLLALSEIDHPSAIEEMRYASPACERYLRRPPKIDRTSQRRHLLARRILEKC